MGNKQGKQYEQEKKYAIKDVEANGNCDNCFSSIASSSDTQSATGQDPKDLSFNFGGSSSESNTSPMTMYKFERNGQNPKATSSNGKNDGRARVTGVARNYITHQSFEDIRRIKNDNVGSNDADDSNTSGNCNRGVVINSGKDNTTINLNSNVCDARNNHGVVVPIKMDANKGGTCTSKPPAKVKNPVSTTPVESIPLTTKCECQKCKTKHVTHNKDVSKVVNATTKPRLATDVKTVPAPVKEISKLSPSSNNTSSAVPMPGKIVPGQNTNRAGLDKKQPSSNVCAKATSQLPLPLNGKVNGTDSKQKNIPTMSKQTQMASGHLQGKGSVAKQGKTPVSAPMKQSKHPTGLDKEQPSSKACVKATSQPLPPLKAKVDGTASKQAKASAMSKQTQMASNHLQGKGSLAKQGNTPVSAPMKQSRHPTGLNKEQPSSKVCVKATSQPPPPLNAKVDGTASKQAKASAMSKQTQMASDRLQGKGSVAKQGNTPVSAPMKQSRHPTDLDKEQPSCKVCVKSTSQLPPPLNRKVDGTATKQKNVPTMSKQTQIASDHFQGKGKSSVSKQGNTPVSAPMKQSKHPTLPVQGKAKDILPKQSNVSSFPEVEQPAVPSQGKVNVPATTKENTRTGQKNAALPKDVKPSALPSGSHATNEMLNMDSNRTSKVDVNSSHANSSVEYVQTSQHQTADTGQTGNGGLSGDGDKTLVTAWEEWKLNYKPKSHDLIGTKVTKKEEEHLAMHASSQMSTNLQNYPDNTTQTPAIHTHPENDVSQKSYATDNDVLSMLLGLNSKHRSNAQQPQPQQVKDTHLAVSTSSSVETTPQNAKPQPQPAHPFQLKHTPLHVPTFNPAQNTRHKLQPQPPHPFQLKHAFNLLGKLTRSVKSPQKVKNSHVKDVPTMAQNSMISDNSEFRIDPLKQMNVTVQQTKIPDFKAAYKAKTVFQDQFDKVVAAREPSKKAMDMHNQNDGLSSMYSATRMQNNLPPDNLDGKPLDGEYVKDIAQAKQVPKVKLDSNYQCQVELLEKTMTKLDANIETINVLKPKQERMEAPKVVPQLQTKPKQILAPAKLILKPQKEASSGLSGVKPIQETARMEAPKIISNGKSQFQPKTQPILVPANPIVMPQTKLQLIPEPTSKRMVSCNTNVLSTPAAAGVTPQLPVQPTKAEDPGKKYAEHVFNDNFSVPVMDDFIDKGRKGHKGPVTPHKEKEGAKQKWAGNRRWREKDTVETLKPGKLLI